jgi:hypothetical protein
LSLNKIIFRKPQIKRLAVKARDGKKSVGFLVKIKEMLENPERIIFGAKDPMEVLLGL